MIYKHDWLGSSSVSLCFVRRLKNATFRIRETFAAYDFDECARTASAGDGHRWVVNGKNLGRTDTNVENIVFAPGGTIKKENLGRTFARHFVNGYFRRERVRYRFDGKVYIYIYTVYNSVYGGKNGPNYGTFGHLNVRVLNEKANLDRKIADEFRRLCIDSIRRTTRTANEISTNIGHNTRYERLFCLAVPM